MNLQSKDGAALRVEMNLNRHEVGQRIAWFGLEDEDAARLARIDKIVAPHVGSIIDALVSALLVPGNGSAPSREASRDLLCHYFGGLTNADDFGDSFVDRRVITVKALQDQVSPDVTWYLAAYLYYLNQVGARVRDAGGDPEEIELAYQALGRVVFFDLSLAIDTHVFDRNRTIRAQQLELAELSNPVLQLREGLLILPIVGTLDSRRAQQLTEQLLMAIRDRRGKVVVLDVTGVASVDSGVANHLIQTVDAARLMGATAIVTGVSPEVAQTLVGLGISLGNVTTIADLQGGVDEADRILGLRVVPVEGFAAEARER